MHTISNTLIGSLVSFKDVADRDTQKMGRIIAVTDSEGQIQIYVAQFDTSPWKIHYLGLHQVQLV